MINNFALLDKDFNVIGTIALPDYLPSEFANPFHVPHAKIEEGEQVVVGMKYDAELRIFTSKENFPISFAQLTTTPLPVADQAQDIVPPKEKRNLFRFFRRAG